MLRIEYNSMRDRIADREYESAAHGTLTAGAPPKWAGAHSRVAAADARSRTLGPVSDLERHLPSEWWRTLFNSLYLETDGDIVENDRNTRQEVDLLIRSAGVERNDRMLDLCCGQGRHSLELARRGFQRVTGLDRSRYLIRLAKKRAKQGNLQVSFHEGDARRFRLGDGDAGNGSDRPRYPPEVPVDPRGGLRRIEVARHRQDMSPIDI